MPNMLAAAQRRSVPFLGQPDCRDQEIRMHFLHHARAAASLAALGLLTMTAATTGCGGGQNPLISLDSVTAEQLRSAPEQVTLGSGQSLRLEAFLNRDFQPISPPNGKPMLAVLRVRTTDETPIPADVRVESAWAVYGQEIWDVKPAEEQPRTPGSPSFEVVGRNGPKWGPNVGVDVVVQVRDGGNTTYRLQARQVPVSRSD